MDELININSFLICNKCRELKQITNFMKVVDIQTYGIDSDKDGFIQKVRFYKTCIECRTTLRKLAKITRNLKKIGKYERGKTTDEYLQSEEVRD